MHLLTTQAQALELSKALHPTVRRQMLTLAELHTLAMRLADMGHFCQGKVQIPASLESTRSHGLVAQPTLVQA